MARARILVVEDDSIIAMELEDRLQRLDYDVLAVTASGEDAVVKASELRPDLVLMDIRLKGLMDGIVAALEIRAHFDIPVVYLTAYADDHTLERAKVTEPFGYIIKPFEERELHTTIEMALYKHEMEKKLKEREQWLAATLRSIGDAVIVTDRSGLVSLMNPVAETLTGRDLEDAMGKESAEILRIDGQEGIAVSSCPVTRALHEGTGSELAGKLIPAKSEHEIPIDGNTALIRDEKGNIDGAVIVFRDISDRLREEQERERLQAQLFQAQRMEAVGVLAGGIVHDFNNMMTTIMGYSSLILSKLGEEDPLQAGIEYIKQAGERAASLTEQLLLFTRKQAPGPKAFDLNTVVIDMEEMLRRFVGEDTKVDSALEPGFRYVKANPTQIEQVIMNLVINAHEAMPGGGKLTIKTENVTLDEDQCRDIPDAYPGTFVCLSVSDTGAGMDEKTLRQIFKPFFSTKDQGTGLGLSIVSSIIKQHKGWIAVSSTPSQGSTFRVYLPAYLGDVDYQPEAIIPVEEFQGTGERILVIEDDPGVRAAVSEMLRANGYVVVEAEGANAALDVFDKHKGDFQLVLCDIVLPDLDGLELVDALLAQNPSLAVLLTSGYADQRIPWPLLYEKGYGFLQKPYGLVELLPVVKKVIAGGHENPGE
jgi:PAS domain S-box-containing protein